MTAKRVLLVIGIAAAIGIGWWAFYGNPTDEGQEGAIGAANRYTQDQVSDADVQLADAEVATLMQDDAFLDLIQDPDFQTLMAREDFADALAKSGVEAVYGGMDPAATLSHRDVASLAGREDVVNFLRQPEVAAAFEQTWKMAGEGNTKDGRIGRSSNVWSRESIDALQKQLVTIINDKHYTFDYPVDDGKVKLKAQEIVQLLSRPAVVTAMAHSDVREQMLGKEYIALAQSWKMAGEGNTKDGRIGRSSNVWEQSWKMAGEGNTKDGRIGRSSNVWSAREVEVLAKLPEVAALEKTWKMAGEGNTKDGRIGRSSNVWQQYSTTLQKTNIAEALSQYDVAVLLARPDVQATLEKLNTADAWSAQNIEATLGKFEVGGAPSDGGSAGGR